MKVCIPFALDRRIKIGNEIRPIVAYYIVDDMLTMVLQNGNEYDLTNEIVEKIMEENHLDDITIDTVYEIGDNKYGSRIKSFTYDARGLYTVLEDKSIKTIE